METLNTFLLYVGDIILSPYFVALLSLLVVAKWIFMIRITKNFGLVGGVIPRFIILLIYSYISIFEPPIESYRLFIRAAIQLLFIDEIVHAVVILLTREKTWKFNRLQR